MFTLALIGLTLILTLRSWPRLHHTDVWQEDALNLIGWVRHGLFDLVEPVNGYLIVVPKVITQLSALISISHYPSISIAIGSVLVLAVCAVIAKAPLKIKGGGLLAVAALLVPTDAEVFGLPLYTFWWTTLLLMLLPFWRPERDDFGWRLCVLVLASLSSPVCAIVMPLMWMKAVLADQAHRRTERMLALAITLCVALQVWSMHRWQLTYSEQTAAGGLQHLSLDSLAQIIPSFLGAYLVGNTFAEHEWSAGLLLLACLALGSWKLRRHWLTWAMAYLWLSVIFMTMGRVDIHLISPSSAGPRYFFLPFILTSWALIHLMVSHASIAVRTVAALFLLTSLSNLAPVLNRKHLPLQWQQHLTSCEKFERYRLPIHADGNLAHAWWIEWTGATCRQLLSKDIFAPSRPQPTVAYRVIGTWSKIHACGRLPGASSLLNHTWQGQDYASVVNKKGSLPGHQVMGSFQTSDADTGEMRLKLHRGDQLWFRSEPESLRQTMRIEGLEDRFISPLPNHSEWTLIEFSNSDLPDEFVLRLSDGGGGWGEWMAVSIHPEH